MLFYPTSETATDTNRAQAMLFNSPASPQAGIVGDPLSTASMPANSNISSLFQDLPTTTTTTNDIHQHHQHAVQTPPCFNDLIAVLIECFSLIAIGYFSGRFKLISPDAKDIGAYLTTFALPMIIFLNVAQMEIQTINLSFLACMLTSKLLLFVLVTAITLAISYPANFSYAGALSILATQSNDFALGYPLFKSLYGESKPEMLSYLNLMGPIQLLVINPLGIVMLEFEKSRANRAMRRRANSILARKRCLYCLENLQNSSPPSPIGPPSDHYESPPPPISIVNPLVGQFQVTSNRGESAPQSQLMRRLNSPIRRLSSEESNQSSDLLRTRGSKNIKSLALVMPARLMPERDKETDPTDERLIDGDCYQRKANNSNSQATPPILRHPAELLGSGTDSVDFETEAAAAAAQRNGSSKPKFSKGSFVNHQEPGQRQRSASPQRAHRLESPIVAAATPAARLAPDTPPPSSKCSCWNNGNAEPGLLEKEPVIDLGFVKALLTNPLIIASVVALAVNLIHGPELPKFVTKVSNTIAASFAAPALFVVGLSMYGKFKLILRNPNDLLLSSVLVLTKVFILPNLMRTIMLMVLPHYTEPEEIPYLADFAYLYGLLPTAPGACIIAKQYEVLTNVVSICMLLSTFISAPMMLGTSAIISQVSATAPETTLNIIAQTLRISSSITLTLSLLTLYMLWKSNRRIMSSLDRIMRNVAELKATHVFTFLLALTQLLIGIGGFLWLFVDTTKLKQQSFIDLMARDGSLLTSSGSGSGGGDMTQHWPRDDMEEDLLAEDERIHALEPHAFMIAPNTHAIGFGALCTMKYVLASGGLLMARFIILCIVFTNFAKHFRGHQLAVQVSSLMLKIYPLFGLGVIMCLVFESRHLSCLPSESSLPTWSFSLYLRATFNGLLLLLAVPLFTATFRLTNKTAWLATQNLHEAGAGSSPGGLLEKRRFVTSNVSLSSDTSSAITTSTNLEATLNGVGANGQQQQAHRAPSASAQQASAATGHDQQPKQQQTSTVLLVDYDTLAQQQQQQQQQQPLVSGGYRPSSCEDKVLLAASEDEARRQQEKQRKKKVITQCDMNNNNCNELLSKSTAAAAAAAAVARQQTSQAADSNQMTKVMMNNDNLTPPLPRNNIPTQQEIETIATTTTIARQAEATSTTAAGINPSHHNWPLPVTEFNKYSILIVFMLFQTLVSLTSIIQLLNQDRPSGGTFVMSEITNVAIDFGQGLVTFLVIGSQSYLKDLISSFGFTSSSARRCTRQQQEPTDSQA